MSSIPKRTVALVVSAAGILVIAASTTPNSDDRPAPLADAAARMTVPDGFKATLFAGEPDVVQPIAFTFDDRGRLWVVECLSYPAWQTDWNAGGHDRVTIFEDTNGDGRFDKRTVFFDRGVNLSGIEFGFGGVWLCSTPNLVFIPDRDGDDRPDGPPEIVLDGWDLTAKHNVFNALRWGPDGWLYGCNGILSNSTIGLPGANDADRVAMNCGVWRYHPTRKKFEAVAHGTTNPWGLDFDDTGECFITNCVIPHLFHVTPGAHFQRMFGQDINPHSFELLPSCADHLHWGGGDWTSSRGGKGVHSEAGGGHAHAGAMIYLGDNWPDEYRGSAFTCNIHGNRVNRDTLRPAGSTFVASHAKDFLLANDDWFRGLELKYGPDGGVFLTDWSDTGECHNYDPKTIHQENGRIFKVTFGEPARARERVDLAKLSDAELVELQLHKNDWFVRHARRLLQERAAAGRDMSAVHESLWKQFEASDDAPKQLRAIWALHATGGLDAAALLRLLGHDDEQVRAWAVRLALDGETRLPSGPGRNVLGKFIELASGDPSPIVQRNLASALQRLPVERWIQIVRPLIQHAEAVSDSYLALMLWYGVEPHAVFDRETSARLAALAKAPLVRRFLARRIVPELDASSSRQIPGPGLTALARQLSLMPDAMVQADLLIGIREALVGQRGLPEPPFWSSFRNNLKESNELRDLADIVALAFLDGPTAPTPRAAAKNTRQLPPVDSLLATMMDLKTPRERRVRVIEALVEYRVPAVESLQRLLVIDPATRGAVLRGLAAYDDASTPKYFVNLYGLFTDAERADAIGTLASRPAYAAALLDAVEAGKIPSRDISVFVARQLQAFGKPEISGRLEKLWGTIRPTAKDKAALTEKYKAMLAPERLAAANTSAGRVVFARTCGQCHRLYGEGGEVGPDLTGSNRFNVDYILENVLDPSAVVPREYKLTVIATKSGRVISGIIRERTDRVVIVQTANERVTLAADDIDELKELPTSMMPEGSFDKLTADEIRDLVAYLATKSQVPPPRSE